MKSDSKKALILLSGALAGAFSAGFVVSLCRTIGIDYFDSVYGYSVGSYNATFGVANQPDDLEKLWRNHVDGYKLINRFNILTFGVRPILKLEYLEKLFEEKYKINFTEISKSSIELRFALMDSSSAEVDFISPNKGNILQLMSAASAVPLVHGVYSIGKQGFLDPNFIYGMPPGLDKIISKYDEVLVVNNFPKNYVYYHSFLASSMNKFLFPIISKFYSKSIQKVFQRRTKLRIEFQKYLSQNPKVTLISPEKMWLRSSSDTDKVKINKTFDEGIDSAIKYLKSLGFDKHHSL